VTSAGELDSQVQISRHPGVLPDRVPKLVSVITSYQAWNASGKIYSVGRRDLVVGRFSLS